jgi:hypothetical protein
MTHALALSAAISAARCDTSKPYARIHLVGGMPFVQGLRPGLVMRVETRRRSGETSRTFGIYEADDRTGGRARRHEIALAYISFQDGTVRATNRVTWNADRTVVSVLGPQCQGSSAVDLNPG